MGMSVIGVNPASEVGKNYHANLHWWGTIWALMASTCGDIIDKETLKAILGNDGAGPDAETCLKIANQLEDWAGPPGELENCRIIAKDVAGEPSLDEQQLESLAMTIKKEVLDWTAFLRHCGGFVVW